MKKGQSSSQDNKFLITLKRDPASLLYTLDSISQPRVFAKPGQLNSHQKNKNLKRTHQQMNSAGNGADFIKKGGNQPQSLEIVGPNRPKRQAAQKDPGTYAKDSVPDFESERRGSGDESQLIDGKEDLDEDGLENDMDESQTKIDENEMEYSKSSFIIPSCSGWFNLDKIHEIEMQSLPEFFCGKFPHKNPVTYMDYRNFIIKLYREAPNSYLSATVCRKNLPSDVCSIIRLHAFLEHWGLINFNVDPQLRPIKIQLAGSGSLNANLIDVAAKGYLKLNEAEQISSFFQKDDSQVETNASQNVYLIAAKKINLISTHKRPTCNFCGNLCGPYWYKKKPSINTSNFREENALKALGEYDSLHHTLKSLTSTYMLCKECFLAGNIPRILTTQDFEKFSLETILRNPDFQMKVNMLHEDEGLTQNDMYQQEWSAQDREQLVEGVSQYDSNWETISEKVFQGRYSSIECAYQFIGLPISESLLLKFQNASLQQQEEFVNNYVPTVFQDFSNPLLSQLAILAKSLEYQDQAPTEADNQKSIQELFKKQVEQQQQIQQHENEQQERRTTRKQQAQKKKELDQVQETQLKQVHEDIGDFYLIPQVKAQACMTREMLETISERASQKSRRLAKQQRKEIKKYLNLAIYHQQKKLQEKAKFMRDFWKIFDVESNDLHFMKEEALAERVALSVIKSGEIKGTQTEKILATNEFASTNSLLRQII